VTSQDSSSGSEVERMMLEAILEGDGKSWRSLASTLSGERAFEVMGVATSAAVFRKWPQDPSLSEIAEYSSEISRRFPADLPVGVSVIESIIRGVLGEPELVKGTPGKDIIVAELLIVKSIQFDVLTEPAERQAYIAEILTAVSSD
jgi:hypothetical protein